VGRRRQAPQPVSHSWRRKLSRGSPKAALTRPPRSVAGCSAFLGAASYLDGSGPRLDLLLRSKNFLQSRLHQRDVLPRSGDPGGTLWAAVQMLRDRIILKATEDVSFDLVIGDETAKWLAHVCRQLPTLTDFMPNICNRLRMLASALRRA
jgi:hypothetical protein